MTQEFEGPLTALIAETFGLPDTRIISLERLTGGASRQTWLIEHGDANGAPRKLILRKEPPGVAATKSGLEAQVLAAALAAGVPVPRVYAHGLDDSLLGSPFLLMEQVDGEAIPRKVLRDAALDETRPKLAQQCGEILGRIHSIPKEGIAGLVVKDPLADCRERLDRMGQQHPAFELAIRWAVANRPAASGSSVVHGDFRNGNLLIAPGGVQAVLDWEQVHIGDPAEDLGWFCAVPWRFGEAKPAGGWGDYDDLLDAYAETTGKRIPLDTLLWWELVGTLYWGVLCIAQAMRYVDGINPSVELAALGRRVSEMEWDVLKLLPGGREICAAVASEVGAIAAVAPDIAVHDVPTAAGLVEAVRNFLDSQAYPALEGQVRFHTRVSTNILGMVERELTIGPALATACGAWLGEAGHASAAELAEAVRASGGDALGADTMRLTARLVAAKLRVSKPDYLK